MLLAVTIVARVMQLVCAVVVLGLVFSWQQLLDGFFWRGSFMPYSLFVGVFSVLVGIIGAVAICATSISPRFTMAGDAFAAVFSLCGGILWIVKMGGFAYCSSLSGSYAYRLAGLCQRVHVTQGSMFSTFVMSSVLVWLGYQTLRKRKQDSSV